MKNTKNIKKIVEINNGMESEIVKLLEVLMYKRNIKKLVLTIEKKEKEFVWNCHKEFD